MTTQEKRAQFAKDLDKLVSGEYVLVPKPQDLDESFDRYLVDICGIEPTDYDNEYGFSTDGLRQMWMAAVAFAKGQK